LKHPVWDRPIKVQLIFPIIYIIATIFISVVPMISTPVETAMGLAIIATGLPVYFIFIAVNNIFLCLQKTVCFTVLPLPGSVTVCLQKLMVVFPPPKNSN
jgi:L-type amino acid transporter 8